MSHQMRTKLLFIVAAAGAPMFAIVHHNESVLQLPVLDDVDISVIDQDNEAKAYGAFVGHMVDQYPHATSVGEVRDHWYDWAAANLDIDGKLKDNFFIAQTGELSYDSWSNLGVDKQRSDFLWLMVEATISETPEVDRHTSSIISKVSKFATSHAELVILASNATTQMHKLKDESGKDITDLPAASLQDIEDAQAEFGE